MSKSKKFSLLDFEAPSYTDGMTAAWFPMPYDALAKMSNRIINEVHGINRVVYEITNHPGTIELE